MYTVIFESDSDAANYLVTTKGRSIPVDVVDSTFVNNIRSDRSQTDHIIIAHPDFLQTAEGLKLDRERQGLISRLVSLADIYATYSGGTPAPEAIRMFLHEAYHTWDRPKPGFVVLVGAGHWDPKGHFRYATSYYPSFVPSYINTQGNKAAASDNVFVCLEGNDLMPEMALGRIPVTTAAELQGYVEKLAGYRSIPYGVDPQVIMVADHDKQGSGPSGDISYVYDFMQHAESVISVMRPEVGVRRLYADVEQDSAGIRQGLLDVVNSNQALGLSYFGHGGFEEWGAAQFLSIGSLSSLQVGHKPLVIMESDCLAADFYNLGDDSLGDRMIRALGKGAVVYVGSSGQSGSSDKQALMKNLFTLVYREDQRVLGAAFTQAKVRSLLKADSDVGSAVQHALLLGDPSVKMDLPYPSAPTGITIEYGLSEIEIGWEPDTKLDVHYNVHRTFDAPSKWLGKKGKRENKKRRWNKVNKRPVRGHRFRFRASKKVKAYFRVTADRLTP